MRYLVLATDYDGTLATHGRVEEPVLAGLERLLGSGRKLVMVTGRELPDLQSVFDRLDLFEWIVAENGALLYKPGSREEKLLAPPAPEAFVEALRGRGVGPLSVGRSIVATWHPHETAVLEVIRELGLEMQVIFNKDAVMVLPSGFNKATGLKAALKEMGLSPHNVVGVGDAENDHAFLSLCECSVAVANALPTVQETADYVTRGDHGKGVLEVIDRLIEDDLQGWEGRLERHHLLLGTRDNGTVLRVPPWGLNLLIAGPSGSGKSTVATAFLERLAEQKYQACVIDPEGDYQNLDGAITLGTSQRGPGVDEVLQLLAKPDANAVINLVGLPLTDRPSFFLSLLPRLLECRARTGRPHWLLIDEAHHLLPASWEPGAQALPEHLDQMAFITVHPGQVAPSVLKQVNTLVIVGDSPETVLQQFCDVLGEKPPTVPIAPAESGHVLYWSRSLKKPLEWLHVKAAKSERLRHSRKYAEGELPPEKSFFFQGPDKKLNLRAHNLIFFNQLAEGVDDATWMFHLRQGDYSRWFRERIKDEALAIEAARIESLTDVSPRESRELIRSAIEQHYTLPASPPLPIPGTDAAGRKQGP